MSSLRRSFCLLLLLGSVLLAPSPAAARRLMSRREISRALDHIHAEQRRGRSRSSTIAHDLVRLFPHVRGAGDRELSGRFKRAVWLEQATKRGSRATVELELDLTGKLAARMKLRHGEQLVSSVEPHLLDKIWGSKAGRAVIDKATRKAKRSSARELTWGDLAAVSHRGESGQVHFLRELYRGGSQQQFFHDRSMPHVELVAGKHGADARVEFRSPADRALLRGVEVHRSGQQWASELSQLGAALAKDVQPGRADVGQHIHVTFKRSGRGLMQSFRRADHWRRSCLALELLAVERFAVLTRSENGGAVFFDYSKPAQLSRLFEHLRGKQPLGASELKIATIGYRSGMYQGRGGAIDRGIDGYELRALKLPLGGRDGQARQRSALVDAIQRGATRGSDGLSHGQLNGWYRANVGSGSDRAASQALAQLHYNGSIDHALARLRAGGQGYTDAMQRAAHAAAGWLDTRVVEQNYALKMLVHPWSQDPIFHAIGDSRARTAAVIKAHDAQVRALEKLAKVGGRKDPKRGNVMRILADFVRDSGLLDVTARSLGAQHHGYPFSG